MGYAKNWLSLGSCWNYSTLDIIEKTNSQVVGLKGSFDGGDTNPVTKVEQKVEDYFDQLDIEFGELQTLVENTVNNSKNT